MSIFKSVYSLIFLKGLPPLLFNIKLGVQLNKKNRNETVSYLNKNCRCISSDGIKHMYKSSHYFHADVIKFIGGKILSTDSWTGWFQYTPLNFVSGGIKMLLLS